MGHMKGFQLDYMLPKFTLWKNLQLLNYWFLKVKFDVTSFLLSPPTIPHIVNSCLTAFCNKVSVSGSFSVYVGWSTGDWNDNDNWAHLIPRGRRWGDQDGFFRVHFTRSAVNCLAQQNLRCKWYFPGDLLFSQSAVRDNAHHVTILSSKQIQDQCSFFGNMWQFDCSVAALLREVMLLI